MRKDGQRQTKANVVSRSCAGFTCASPKSPSLVIDTASTSFNDTIFGFVGHGKEVIIVDQLYLCELCSTFDTDG